MAQLSLKGTLSKVLQWIDATNMYVSGSATGETTLNGATVNIGNSSTSAVNMKGSTVADFVIQNGTYGIFSYRKWYSGVSECWGIWSGNLTHYVTVGPFYGYHVDNLAFPTGLFVATPVANVNCTVASGFAIPAANLGLSSSQMNLYTLATASGTQPCSFYIHAVGRWK